MDSIDMDATVDGAIDLFAGFFNIIMKILNAISGGINIIPDNGLFWIVGILLLVWLVKKVAS